MPGGNVNGVTIASAASAVAVFSGSDIGVGGFVDAPSLSYNFGVAPPDGSYTVGLINHGIIQVVAGTDVNANGLYGPGNYLLEVPQGSVYVQYSHGIAGATVYIDNASGGFTYLTNTRSIAGLAQIRTVGGPASVNNSGFIGGVALSGGSGTLQNSGVIAGYSDAVAGDFDILNTGLLYATATVGVGGQLLTNTSGTVTNQGTILGDVQAGAVVNSKLISGTGVFVVSSYQVTNLSGGTILATGSMNEAAIDAVGSFGSIQATMVNAGLIEGTNFGIDLNSGFVNNQQTGTIVATSGFAIVADGYATLNNAGTILSTGPLPASYNGFVETLGDGVYLTDGGTLINQAGALISTQYGFGADVIGYESTLLNYGTITAANSGQGGAQLGGDATLVNHAGAVIQGSQYGVTLFDGDVSVSNAGTIVARPALGGAPGSIGVDFSTDTAQSYLTNAASGTISGSTGVMLMSADGTVVNDGVIAGRGRLGSGVTLADGGTVTNQVGGTISGYYLFKSYGVAIGGDAGTVENLGTIFGRTKGVYLGAGGTLNNGGTIGVVAGTAGYDAVQLTGTIASTVFNAGTIGATGDTVNVNGITAFGGLYLNNRLSALIAGNNAVRSTSGVTTLLNYGTITTAGTVDQSTARAGDARQGIYLSGTGGTDYVLNSSSGTIFGYGGLYIQGIEATVVNAGTIGAYRIPISVAGGSHDYLNLEGAGVVLGAGGSLINTGLIQSRVSFYSLGVNGNSTAAIDVTNSGTIFGLILPSGSVSNQAGGTIVDLYVGGGGTVVNAGTISYERAYDRVIRTKVGSALGGSPFGSTAPLVSVTNLAGGVISATGTSAYGSGGSYSHVPGRGILFINASVANYGTILAAGTGIGLTYTGVVMNRGLIDVTGTGVKIGNGTLINTGKIIAASGSYETSSGNPLEGNVTHQYNGAAAEVTTGTVINMGVMSSEVIVDSGMIYNGPGGAVLSVAGGDGAGAALTVVNAGTIGQAGNAQQTAVALDGSGQNRLVVRAGAVFNGTLAGSGAATTLEFASGVGRLAGFGGSVTNFGKTVFDPGAAWIVEGSGAGLGASVFSGFAPGDGIDVDGFVAQSSSYLNGVLSLTSASLGVVSLSVPGDFTTASFTVGSDGAGGTDVTVACFLAGTKIRVPRGEAVVEDLAIGDLVLTVSGAARPIHWIGRRSYAGRFLARNPRLLPICFAAGSLGQSVPTQDLFVSPDHAILIDGLLIPAGELVNGSTIRRTSLRPRVDYIHIELTSHDAVLAHGAAAETFLDDDSRGVFQNAREYGELYPDAPPPGRFCAPRRVDGFELEAIRQRLDRLAAAAA